MAQLRVRTPNKLNVARAFLTCALLGSSWLAAPASAATFTFESSSGITIPSFGPADLYPSIITVAEITDPIAKVTVQLTGFSHDYPSDVGALLVGPGGQKTFLFDGAGSPVNPQFPADDEIAENLTWTFDDNEAPLPPTGPLTSGTFKPSAYFAAFDVFDAPAPGGPHSIALSVFNGLSGDSANGLWRLYIQDFGAGDGGSLESWSLTITTVPEPTSLALIGLALAGYAARRRRPTTSV